VDLKRVSWLPISLQDSDCLHSGEQIRQRNPRLEASELGADAEVRSVPESEMRSSTAHNIESIGIDESRWVAVGSSYHRKDSLAGRNVTMRQQIVSRRSAPLLEEVGQIGSHLVRHRPECATGFGGAQVARDK
jgi:hypothetical protein